MAEGLAASMLLDKTDPTRLTWREIKNSYGSALNFFTSFGLKPWDSGDCDQALSISREMKKNDVEDQEDLLRDRQLTSLWHARLGHIDIGTLRMMITNNSATGMDVFSPQDMDEEICSTCFWGRS